MCRWCTPSAWHAADSRTLGLAADRVDDFEGGGSVAAAETDPVRDVDFLRVRVYRDGQIADAEESSGKQQTLNFCYGDLLSLNRVEMRCESIACFELSEVFTGRQVVEVIRIEGPRDSVEAKDASILFPGVIDLHIKNPEGNIKVRDRAQPPGQQFAQASGQAYGKLPDCLFASYVGPQCPNARHRATRI